MTAALDRPRAGAAAGDVLRLARLVNAGLLPTGAVTGHDLIRAVPLGLSPAEIAEVVHATGRADLAAILSATETNELPRPCTSAGGGL